MSKAGSGAAGAPAEAEESTKAAGVLVHLGGGQSYVRHVAELALQVVTALEALHDKGIYHRDIKPHNIIVGPEGKNAVLMDLGLAQLADEVNGRLTKTRQFIGTLRYASPEQVLAVGRMDARSDIYSMGATLWEMLALRPLYGATEDTPDVELMRRIQVEEAEAVRRQNPAVPRDLAAIVEKCLQKDARNRYATARELAADLDRYLQGRPVQARPVGRARRTLMWARRRPAVAGLIALSLLALAPRALSGFLFAQKYPDRLCRQRRSNAQGGGC